MADLHLPGTGSSPLWNPNDDPNDLNYSLTWQQAHFFSTPSEMFLNGAEIYIVDQNAVINDQPVSQVVEQHQNNPQIHHQGHYYQEQPGVVGANETLEESNRKLMEEIDILKQANAACSCNSQVCEVELETSLVTTNDDTTTSENQLFRCIFCDATYKNKGRVIQHEFQAHCCHPKRAKCQLCGQIFHNRGLMMAHKEKNHPTEKRQPNKNGKCDVCQIKFNTRRSMAMHLKKFHPELSIPPSLCLCQNCSRVRTLLGFQS